MKAILKHWQKGDPKAKHENYFIVEEIITETSSGKVFKNYKPIKRICNGQEGILTHKNCEFTENELIFI